MGYRTCTPGVPEEVGHTADTSSDKCSRLQRLASGHLTNGAPGAGARAASGQVDEREREDSSHSRHRDRNPLGPGTHRHSRKSERRSPRESGERGPQIRDSARASIHLGGEQDKRNPRSKDGGDSSMGSRQMQQALRLQTKRHRWEQETHPQEYCKMTGSQVVQTEIQTRTSGTVPRIIRTARQRQMLVVQWRTQDGSPDAGVSLLPLQPMENPAGDTLERGGESYWIESRQMRTGASP